ncbi:hypothetical protein B0H19DRAFT_1078970 [Mycena capillaripes]|nr:hypothetical protein B0H19DRAFT_1078970 [Mycena capillaripes]
MLYRAGLLSAMRGLLFSWTLSARDHSKLNHLLALPEMPGNHPLPPNLFIGRQKVGSSLEWIAEYGTEQIHHNYAFEFGFWGSLLNGFEVWGICSGDIWLARLEIPSGIYEDPTFVLSPDVVFTGMLESLAHEGTPVRIVESELDVVIQIEGQEGPGWRRHYQLPLRGLPKQLIATHELHTCQLQPLGLCSSRELLIYPDSQICSRSFRGRIPPDSRRGSIGRCPAPPVFSVSTLGFIISYAWFSFTDIFAQLRRYPPGSVYVAIDVWTNSVVVEISRSRMVGVPVGCGWSSLFVG